MSLVNFWHRLSILPTIPSATFPVKALSEDKCNLNAGISANPTPFYNTSILEDQLIAENDEVFQSVYQRHKTDMLSQAMSLLRVWLETRCLLETSDCLSEHAWFGIISHFLSEGSIVSSNHIIYYCVNSIGNDMFLL